MLFNFWSDLRYAARSLSRGPGFTAVAIVTLAVGIGANTAIFSVVNAVLLKPVPFPEPDTLVQLISTFENGNPNNPAASPAKFMHWRAQDDVLEDVAAFRNSEMNYTAGDIPELLTVSLVSEAYFRAFGAPILQGRTVSDGAA